MRRWSGLMAVMLAASCAHEPRAARVPFAVEGEPAPMGSYDDLTRILQADAELAPAVDDADRRRVQVLIAIPHERDGTPALRRFAYRADAEYFYPASSVKLCAAVAAVEKLDELRRDRKNLALSTPLRVVEGGERGATIDTTLRAELEKALVVSDNAAYNRLFDFVGRDELAERMSRLGLRSARVVHRLGDRADAPPAAFELLGDGRPVLVAQRIGFEPPLADVPGLLVGTAHVDATGRLVGAPLDFADKNRVSLRDLQDLLVSVMRPDLAEAGVARLAPGDRDVLVSILGTLPSELGGAPARALDDLHKPLYGSMTRAMPGHRLRVYGRGGRAYGFAVENAYVVDATTKKSAFIAATIYANDNDTLNDDRYDYAEVAEPFIVRLGHVVARAFLGADE